MWNIIIIIIAIILLDVNQKSHAIAVTWMKNVHNYDDNNKRIRSSASTYIVYEIINGRVP